MNCNTTHYRANSSSVPGDPTGFRLQEIDDKKKRLDDADKANKALFGSLDRNEASLKGTIEADIQIQTDTVNKFTEASRDLAEAHKLQTKAQTDPFKVADQLEVAKGRLAAVERLMKSDRELYAEAKRSIATATEKLASASNASKTIDANEVPDSERTNQEQLKLTRLAAELRELTKTFEQARRGDWSKFDREADRITAAIANAHSSMQAEDAAGKEALRDLETASRAVRTANGWSGNYGISVSGSPGSDSLRRAKEFLQRGDYGQASTWADKAESSADSAVAEAESRVRAEKSRRDAIEAAERAAEAARRAAARRSSSSSSSGGFGGGFGGRSSGGFSSGGFGGRSSGGW